MQTKHYIVLLLLDLTCPTTTSTYHYHQRRAVPLDPGSPGPPPRSHPCIRKDELCPHCAVQAQADLVRGAGPGGGLVRSSLPHYPGLRAQRYECGSSEELHYWPGCIQTRYYYGK